MELLRRLEAHPQLSPDTHTYAVILAALHKVRPLNHRTQFTLKPQTPHTAITRHPSTACFALISVSRRIFFSGVILVPWQAGEWRGALRLLDVARDRQGQDEVDLGLLKAALDICIRQGRVRNPPDVATA